jgi:para-aminobenzoate synthetase component 2
VCLGHQAIGVAFGGTVDRAPELLHGKTSTVYHTNCGVLQGLPDPFTATRYHSLTILPETMPAELEVTARTQGGVVMAVRHVTLPIHGVQFHPESILTEGGHRMLANWLGYCGQAPAESLVRGLEQEVADTVRHAIGGQERSDSGISSGGQERSDSGISSGGQERSDSGISSGGQPELSVTTQS